MLGLLSLAAPVKPLADIVAGYTCCDRQKIQGGKPVSSKYSRSGLVLKRPIPAILTVMKQRKDGEANESGHNGGR